MVRRPPTPTSAANGAAVDGARRLGGLADTAGSPAEIYDAAAAELLALDGVGEVHVQRLSAAVEPGFAVAYSPGAPQPRRVYGASLAESPAVQRALEGNDALVVPEPDELPPDLAAAVPAGAGVLLMRVGPAGAARALITVTGPPEAVHGPEVTRAGEMLAAVAGAAIAALEGRLASSTDPHTGCLNEAAMASRLDEEIGRARRHGTRLACLLLALDDLESIGRHYGTAMAEHTLGHVGAVLRREFRRFDRVAYLGRGEFAIVLPGAGGTEGEVVARRALRRLHAVKIEDDGERRPLRASIGLGEWHEPQGAWELVASARAAMLRAGQRDGNGVPAGPLAAS